jgi:hypothetical protein
MSRRTGQQHEAGRAAVVEPVLQDVGRVCALRVWILEPAIFQHAEGAGADHRRRDDEQCAAGEDHAATPDGEPRETCEHAADHLVAS